MKNCFQISHNKDNYTKPIYFHSHDFYEIYFFVDGNVKYYVENESFTLSKGDVLVIPPGKLHRPVFEGEYPYDRYVLWIYGHYAAGNEGISGFISEINRMTAEKNTRRVSFEGEALRGLTALFDKLLGVFPPENTLSFCIAESCISLILGDILESFRAAPAAAEQPPDLIRQVISRINRSVADAPSLEQLSAEFFVSKYYLSHKFREHTRTTVHQYILMKKVNLAKELLECGEPPKTVCDMCGFSTYSNFYKAFTRQTGISPREFVQQNERHFTSEITSRQ